MGFPLKHNEIVEKLQPFKKLIHYALLREIWVFFWEKVIQMLKNSLFLSQETGNFFAASATLVFLQPQLRQHERIFVEPQAQRRIRRGDWPC
ncbi:MAG: hypothetical protein CMN84_09880 [Spongiibacteraceae bacterium]|nr:hypothetical protein [Spongiibacteraceae bacterium]